MTTGAILPWIAIGSLLLIGYAVVRAIALAQVALRRGGKVEVEVKASLSVCVRASRSRLDRADIGEGFNATLVEPPREPKGTESGDRIG